jgi:hypothetical protein
LFNISFTIRNLGAFFAGLAREKPGYPLQFLGFAYANPAGFPLLSLARPGGFWKKKVTVTFLIVPVKLIGKFGD